MCSNKIDLSDFQPTDTPARIVDSETGEDMLRDITHAEAWGLIIESGKKHWVIYENDIQLYHQPWMVM